MICGITCIIALVFLIANIYIIFSCSNNKELKKNFLNVLNEEQKITYEKIIDERKNIYYGGYILGIIFGCSIGLIRILAGAHFLSDVLFAGLITILLNLVFFKLQKRYYG